jgi:hypothetical protein
MNRVDLALALDRYDWADERDSTDAQWLRGRGRDLKRSARLDAQATRQRQCAPMSVRLQGWRRMIEPRGYSFWSWSTMSETAFRRQCHLAVLRGSETAARHLAMMLVSDIKGAA